MGGGGWKDQDRIKETERGDRGSNKHEVSFITVRKRSCGKVMFSQACVKNSVWGAVCLSGSWEIVPGQTPPLGRRHPPLGRHPHPLLQTLRILLECILVLILFCFPGKDTNLWSGVSGSAHTEIIAIMVPLVVIAKGIFILTAKAKILFSLISLSFPTVNNP